MDKLAAYVNSKGYTLEELGVSGFVMPKSGVLSFGQLMEIYLNNKNIFAVEDMLVVVEGMLVAVDMLVAVEGMLDRQDNQAEAFYIFIN